MDDLGLKPGATIVPKLRKPFQLANERFFEAKASEREHSLVGPPKNFPLPSRSSLKFRLIASGTQNGTVRALENRGALRRIAWRPRLQNIHSPATLHGHDAESLGTVGRFRDRKQHA